VAKRYIHKNIPVLLTRKEIMASLPLTEQVKKKILRHRAQFTHVLSSQLAMCASKAAHFRNSQKFRNWITKNIFQEYGPKLMWYHKLTSGEGAKILKAFYGTKSSCDISDFTEHVKRLGLVFDLFGQDTRGTITVVKEWFENKGVSIPGAYFLQAAVLYAQLSFMGHRVNEMGYGSHNIIATATAKRAIDNRRAVETARKKASEKIHQSNLTAEVAETKPAESDVDTQARNALANLKIDWDEEW